MVAALWRAFFDLEQFPLEILAEAATDAQHGERVRHGRGPFRGAAGRAGGARVVRLATEQLLIKREGSAEVTRGEVALTYDEGGPHRSAGRVSRRAASGGRRGASPATCSTSRYRLKTLT